MNLYSEHRCKSRDTFSPAQVAIEITDAPSTWLGSLGRADSPMQLCRC